MFLATGIWHGAEWTFVAWGLWNGFFIILEKLTGWHKKEGGSAITITQHLYTILVFVFGWVLFRADNISYAWQYFKNMFGLIEKHNITYTLGYYVNAMEILAFVVAVVCAVPVFKNILVPVANKFKHVALNLWMTILFALSVCAIAASTYNPFIYFRF